MRYASAFAATLLFAVTGCMGQTKPAAAVHQRDATPPAKTAGRPAAKPDSVIEAAIRAKFTKSKINAEKFQVHVQGGVATIEGHTEVVQHKGVATRLAKTGGAAAVNNHIQISDAAKQKAAANLEQGRRRAQVKRGDARSDSTPPRTGR
jgi:BON domain